MKPYAVTVPYPAHFSFEECMWLLDRGLDDCLHQITDHSIKKALLINDASVVVELSACDGNLVITVLQGADNAVARLEIKNYITEWLDLERDLNPFYKLIGSNKMFAYMVGKFYGLRVIGIPDLFEALCWAIIGQQINLTFAYRLKRRLVERFGTSVECNDEVYHLFPKPGQLVNATVDELRDMQFSGMKAQFLISLAGSFLRGEMSKEILLNLPDFSSRQKALMQLKGVGIWTANYALMKSLKEATAVPFGDAGLNNLIESKTDHPAIIKIFEGFVGWESYLTFYLWRSLSG